MIRLSLITPEKVVYTGEADSVSIPTATGQIQVLQNHMPLVSILSAGELKIMRDGEVTYLAVSAGYVEVRPGNEVVVLANTAEVASENMPTASWICIPTRPSPCRFTKRLSKS